MRSHRVPHLQGAVHPVQTPSVWGVCVGVGVHGNPQEPRAKELLAGPDLSLRGLSLSGQGSPAPVALTCGGRGLRERPWVFRALAASLVVGRRAVWNICRVRRVYVCVV